MPSLIFSATMDWALLLRLAGVGALRTGGASSLTACWKAGVFRDSLPTNSSTGVRAVLAGVVRVLLRALLLVGLG